MPMPRQSPFVAQRLQNLMDDDSYTTNFIQPNLEDEIEVETHEEYPEKSKCQRNNQQVNHHRSYKSELDSLAKENKEDIMNKHEISNSPDDHPNNKPSKDPNDRQIVLKNHQNMFENEFPDEGQTLQPHPPIKLKQQVSEATRRRMAKKRDQINQKNDKIIVLEESEILQSKNVRNTQIEEKHEKKGNIRRSPLQVTIQVEAPISVNPKKQQLRPVKQLIEILRSNADWSEKSKTLDSLQFILEKSPELLTPHHLEIFPLLVTEIQNLRSSVSKTAILVTGKMFQTFGKSLDAHLDIAVHVLLKKFGEGGQFMINEVDKTLDQLCSNMSPAKAITAFLANSDNKHQPTRLRVARCLSRLTKELNQSQLVKYTQIQTDSEKMMHALATYLRDGLADIRNAAKETLLLLSTLPDFQKAIERTLTHSQVIEIKQALNARAS
ncbi:hypothetical protein HK096_009593, partial [Nowakowskiella sp. JEL0078]